MTFHYSCVLCWGLQRWTIWKMFFWEKFLSFHAENPFDKEIIVSSGIFCWKLGNTPLCKKLHNFLGKIRFSLKHGFNCVHILVAFKLDLIEDLMNKDHPWMSISNISLSLQWSNAIKVQSQPMTSKDILDNNNHHIYWHTSPCTVSVAGKCSPLWHCGYKTLT